MVPSKDTIEQCVSANAKKLQCPVANFPLKNLQKNLDVDMLKLSTIHHYMSDLLFLYRLEYKTSRI
jgi:hypothetical protein